MSNYVKSTNFAIKDSLVTTDPAKIIKGTDIDNEYNAISNAIASKADTNSPALTGTPSAPTATAGSNTTQIANTNFVTAALAVLLPTGVITLWSGAISAIPVGWALCNGSSGTPDLRDRFVVGAGSTYAVGATGGANTVTLDATMIPSHTHAVSITTGTESVGHTHSGTTGNHSTDHAHYVDADTGGHSNDHTHGFSVGRSFGAIYGASEGVAFGNYPVTTGAAVTFPSNTGGTSNNHTHRLSAWTGGVNTGHTHNFSTGDRSAAHTHAVSGNTASTGGGLAHENRPPYYALAYIMKL